MEVTSYWTAYGSSPDGNYLLAIGKPSVGSENNYGYKLYKNIYVRKCPYCGSSELYWGIWWNGSETSGRYAPFPYTGRSEGGSAEGHIFCKDCDADFSCISGTAHVGGGKKLTPITSPILSTRDEAILLKTGQLAFNEQATTGSNSSWHDVFEKTLSKSKDSEDSETVKTHGYDVDNPFLGYFRIEYSLEPGANARRHLICLDFTAKAPDIYHSFGDIKPVMINDTQKVNSTNLINKIRDIHEDKNKELKIYLRQITVCYTTGDDKLYETGDNEDSDSDSKTEDDSSCKIIFNKLGLRKGDVTNPTTLGFSGKTLLSNLQTCLEETKYVTQIEYGKNRFEDRINFLSPNSIDRQTPKVKFSEGVKFKDNYLDEDYVPIIGISDLEYQPIGNTINSSIKIYASLENPTEEDRLTYNYAQSRNREHILRFGEMQDVEVLDDGTSETEAYIEARNNDKLYEDMSMTCTITCEGVPDCDVGDYIEGVFYDENMNDVKLCKSLEISIANDSKEDIPRVKTQVGFGAVEKLLNSEVTMRNNRRKAQEAKVSVSKTVEYNVETPMRWEE